MKTIEIKLDLEGNNKETKISDLTHKMYELANQEKSFFIKAECNIDDVEIIKNYYDGHKSYWNDNEEVVYWNVDDVKENILYISKRYRNFEAEREEELSKWETITAIEKVADFVAKFMRETGIESKEIISNIIDNLHKDWETEMQDLEFRNVEFVKVNAKEFAKEIKLITSNSEHSWAGSEINEDTGHVLYKNNKAKLEFGEDYFHEYSNNGTTENYEESVLEGEFNIKETYVILVKNRNYSDYNNHYYDNTSYKCTAYVGDETAYDFENKEIIKKYEIDNKVLEHKFLEHK